jgi:demethylmenaquinone methyltransferase/2-methoxy-6-polyprenyl-1,4-benzoquinol methylase
MSRLSDNDTNRAAPDPTDVRDLFAVIARRYDLLNHVLSCSIDRLWRRRLVRLAGAGRVGGTVLDICCGTGDIALAFRRRTDARVVGVDFSREMLAVARRKAGSAKGGRAIGLVCADALALPAADGSFGVATMGFGLRNLSDYGGGIAEAVRVLIPGGRLLILEFAPPAHRAVLFLYRLYLRFAVPIIGGLLTGSMSAYEHLSDTIAGFLEPREVIDAMAARGLDNVRAVRLTAGIAYIYIGEKRTPR